MKNRQSTSRGRPKSSSLNAIVICFGGETQLFELDEKQKLKLTRKEREERLSTLKQKIYFPSTYSTPSQTDLFDLSVDEPSIDVFKFDTQNEITDSDLTSFTFHNPDNFFLI